MTQAGQAFQATAAQLATLPPPTFEGGSECPQTSQAAMQSFGQTFTEFGQRVLTIKDGDTAAQQPVPAGPAGGRRRVAGGSDQAQPG